MLIIDISYNSLYVWNCMKLYDKKFLIYGNCMIRSFGQPGLFCFNFLVFDVFALKLKFSFVLLNFLLSLSSLLLNMVEYERFIVVFDF